MIAPDAGSGNGADWQPSAACWDGSRRLWSLWDMLDFKASGFHQIMVLFARISGIVSVTPQEQDIIAADDGRAHLIEQAELLEPHLTTIGLAVSALTARELVFRAKQDDISWGELASSIDELHNTVRRELCTINIFVIEANRRHLFNGASALFGSDVQNKFGTASFEIDEAAKCLSLGRPTAAVFHLMRLMEVGIKATAKCLGVPDPIRPSERNWGYILKVIRGGIDDKWPMAANRVAGDGAFFDSIYASLDAVKNPWRNSTMHVENKYTDDEAEHIFAAVKGFMMKLASRCDEHGDPKA